MKDPSLLKAMVQKVGARRVLEVGTSDGSSALAMAGLYHCLRGLVDATRARPRVDRHVRRMPAPQRVSNKAPARVTHGESVMISRACKIVRFSLAGRRPCPVQSLSCLRGRIQLLVAGRPESYLHD